MKRTALLLCLTASILVAKAQSSQPTINQEEYLEVVKNVNPMIRQALLLQARGELAVSEARGAFDPKLVSNYDKKQFDDKNYFDIWDSYVKVPTLLNVDLKAGYERNSGLFLNPERNVPADGLYYAGVSVPVGQGLVVNKRGIDLKKGKLTRNELAAEGEMLLNNVFIESAYAYWYWYETYRKLILVRSGLSLIGQRFEGIRQGVLNGENAAIDSIETLIQVQNWTNMLAKAELEFQNNTLMVDNFVWDENIDLTGVVPAPEPVEQQSDLSFYVNYALTNHPELKGLVIKGEKLNLERRFNAEQLKPTMNLNYNLLLSETGSSDNPSLLSNNYKAGVNFNFPLLLRKERARLKTTGLRQQENTLKLDQKRREVINKVEQAYNKMTRLREMIGQQNLMVENYQRMLDGERSRFDNGESSIFLINSRENKKLDAEMKLIELNTEYRRSVLMLKWAAGLLSDEILNEINTP